MLPSPDSSTTLSLFDSNHFGLSIARNPHLTCEGIHAANAFCRREHVALLIARCPTTDTDSLLALQDDGFRIVDTLVRWRRSPDTAQPHRGNPSIATRRMVATDSPTVANIARAAFTAHNGHYHSDPQLDTARSTELYVSWAARSCAEMNEDNPVLVAEWERDIAGFLALKRGERNVFEAPLAAVAPEEQGRGILTALLTAAIHESRARGGEYLEYGCVLTNIGAQKSLVRLGFEMRTSYHTLHKWFKS